MNVLRRTLSFDIRALFSNGRATPHRLFFASSTALKKKEIVKVEKKPWYELRPVQEKRPTFVYGEKFNNYTLYGPGYKRSTVAKQEKAFREVKRADKEMKRASDFNYLEVPLSRLYSFWIKEPIGLTEVADAALHYNVLPHVYGKKKALVTVPLSVRFPEGPFVHRGNLLKPTECAKIPEISFPWKSDQLYSIVMSTPDGNLFSGNSEVLHWLVCDIPGDDLSKGHTLCKFLQPIPVEGTGYHRYVFSLLQQPGPIKLRDGYSVADGDNLESRTWSTENFIAAEQLQLLGLSFFQAQWDASVGKTFEKLDFPEPVYELERTQERFLSTRLRAAYLKRRAFQGGRRVGVKKRRRLVYSRRSTKVGK